MLYHSKGGELWPFLNDLILAGSMLRLPWDTKKPKKEMKCGEMWLLKVLKVENGSAGVAIEPGTDTNVLLQGVT